MNAFSDHPGIMRLNLMLFIFLGGAAIDHHSALPIPRLTLICHLATKARVEVPDFRSSRNAVRHRQDLMQLRGGEECAIDSPPALTLEFGLHALKRISTIEELLINAKDILGSFRNRNDGAVLLPIHLDMLTAVPIRRVPTSPESLLCQTDHVIGNTSGNGLPFHLGEDHRDIHHRPADWSGGINIFFDGNKHDTLLFERSVDISEVLHITRDAVKLIDHQSIHKAVRNIRQEPLQTGAVRIGTSKAFVLVALEGLHRAGELQIHILPAHPLLIIHRIRFVRINGLSSISRKMHRKTTFLLWKEPKDGRIQIGL